MSSLTDERIERICKRFLDAGDRFPDLCYAAVTPAQSELLPKECLWPLLHIDDADNLGLTSRLWCEVLNKEADTPLTPIDPVWLRIDGLLWEGGFINGKLFENVRNENETEWHERLQAQFSHLQIAIVEFERLAGMAVVNYDMSPSPTPSVEWWMNFGPASRWLEAVMGMSFISTVNRGRFLVREVPGDIFTASALAIDILRAAGEHSSGADSPGTTGDLIGRLLAGPEIVRLSEEDYAFLCVFLNQPGNRLSLSHIQRGEADPFAKLRLIRDYNRILQKQSSSADLQKGDGINTGSETSLPTSRTERAKGNDGTKPLNKSQSTSHKVVWISALEAVRNELDSWGDYEQSESSVENFPEAITNDEVPTVEPHPLWLAMVRLQNYYPKNRLPKLQGALDAWVELCKYSRQHGAEDQIAQRDKAVNAAATLRKWVCLELTEYGASVPIDTPAKTKQREENGGGVPPTKNVPTLGRKPKPSEIKAYGQWKMAIEQNPELNGAIDEKIYEWVRDNMLDDGEKLPVKGTWKRQLRTARSYHGKRKNETRINRPHGKSIVQENQI
jgi:hypothetical protein